MMCNLWEGNIFSKFVHTPVFVKEVLTYLVSNGDRCFLDCTTGEGGHSEAILYKFPEIKVFGLDRDSEIIKVAKERLNCFGERFEGINLNFTQAGSLKDSFPGILFDSVLIDLGISVYHYKKSKKGFSFLDNEKLDMRLDNEGISVLDIVNSYTEEELANIFFRYGEEKFSRGIAKKIVKERDKNKIELASELAAIITSAIPARFKGKKIHPATKVFQALRIVANNELDNIKKGIPEVLSIMKKGGKLGVITFHSIEDRIVKKMFQELNKECVCPPEIPVCVCNKKKEINILGKVIKPSDEEIQNNPPSRSAKLRIVEKV